MKALHRKLLRDFVTLKGQITAIAVVIAAGVMTLILSLTNLDTLRLTQQRFYDEYQFGEVFADLKRAPDSLINRLREVPEVDQVETRVRAPVRLEVPGFDDPVRGEVVSIPDGSQPLLNRLYVREGRLPISGRSDEVAISEAFAEAHNLHPGDRLQGIIRGNLEGLTISGIVLSPEFVYQVGPSDILPDYERYAVLWMNRRALASAFAMDGAFNNAVFTVQTGVEDERVIEAVDRILNQYGGLGAYAREDQVSHRFLSDELDQLQVMATVLPTIFLGVATFLLHVLMGRIIRTQREQIAVIKAFGYRNGEIAVHYGQLTGLIVLVGSVAGVVLGAWAASGLAGLYLEYYRFPELVSRVQPRNVILAVAVASGAPAFGTFSAVRGAVRLPPAEAMRPPAPERYRRSLIEKTLLGRILSQPSRIILRNLLRHPLKASLSVVGIGLSGALLLIGGYQFSAVDHMIDTQYRRVLGMDLDIALTEPTSESAAGVLRHVPGVVYVEGYRSVPVRLVKGVREYRTAILGMEARPELRRVFDRQGGAVTLPPEGLFLTAYLADYLGVAAGESLEVEVLEGHRETFDVPLAGVVDEPIGVSAYMERRALNRMMGEGPAISGAWLLRDKTEEDVLFERLWEMPRVAGIGLIAQAEGNIRDYMDETILVFMGILLLLAGSIAFAVIYNNARITLAERAHELATLRVLGFTQGEVSWILTGEIGLLTLVSIPIGWGVGTFFALILNRALATDIFRIPFIMTKEIYAFSAGGILVSSLLVGLLTIRRLRRLDMVSALKAMD